MTHERFMEVLGFLDEVEKAFDQSQQELAHEIARAEAAEKRAMELETLSAPAINAIRERALSAEPLLREAREVVKRLYAGAYLTVAGEDWNLKSDADALLAKLAAREGTP